MSLFHLHRTPTAPTAEAEQKIEATPAAPSQRTGGDSVSEPVVVAPVEQAPRGPRGMGRAWAGLFVAIVIATALIVFLVQNTESVAISFLGKTTNASLAVALLIAVVGASLLTLLLATVVMGLRRRARRKQKL